MGKKNGQTKPRAERKPRKVRAKMRSRKENVAGHFADRLAANAKQRADIMKAVAGFPGVDPTVQSAHGVHAKLVALAESGFVPARKGGGRKAVTFAPGQQVTLAPEAIVMLKTLFAAAQIDGAEFFVSNGYTPQPKDSQLPLRLGSADPTATPVGFVSRKWIQNAAPTA